MSNYNFIIGNQYTKDDIYRICSVPVSKQKQNWTASYTNYKGDWFIFCNIAIAGDHCGNRFVGDDLLWFCNTTSHLKQKSISSLLNTKGQIFIFYYETQKDMFTFAGPAYAKEVKDTIPIQITWSFKDSSIHKDFSIHEKEIPKETKAVDLLDVDKNITLGEVLKQLYKKESEVIDEIIKNTKEERKKDHSIISSFYKKITELRKLSEDGTEENISKKSKYILDELDELKDIKTKHQIIKHIKFILRYKFELWRFADDDYDDLYDDDDYNDLYNDDIWYD